MLADLLTTVVFAGLCVHKTASVCAFELFLGSSGIGQAAKYLSSVGQVFRQGPFCSRCCTVFQMSDALPGGQASSGRWRHVAGVQAKPLLQQVFFSVSGSDALPMGQAGRRARWPAAGNMWVQRVSGTFRLKPNGCVGLASIPVLHVSAVAGCWMLRGGQYSSTIWSRGAGTGDGAFVVCPHIPRIYPPSPQKLL